MLRGARAADTPPGEESGGWRRALGSWILRDELSGIEGTGAPRWAENRQEQGLQVPVGLCPAGGEVRWRQACRALEQTRRFQEE